MKKKEIILRELLNQSVRSPEERITQLELAKRLNVSLSTVNHAIESLVTVGAIEIKRNGIKIIDKKKALLYLATIRNLKKDIIYQTYIPMSVSEIEKSMPEGVLYTMFSAYKFHFNEVPADYSEVYVYCDDDTLKEIKSRFRPMKGPPNLFVLKLDDRLKALSEHSLVPLIQIYIDLWNAHEWYAKDFLDALENKLFNESKQ
jgi:DNA-binding transcriptional regulator YhcF (GntR family)